MWHRGKRGFNLARLLYKLRLDHNVLSRDLRDMHVDTCPVADWNGETFQAVVDRLRAWQANGTGARSDGEREAFRSFPDGCDDADFVLHLLRRYDTDLRWWEVTANRNPRRTKKLLFNPLLLPGFNDSGAHLTNMAFYDGNLRMLKMAQEDGVARVAHAVHRLTREPADFLGLDAGLLEVGARADLALVDPQALAAWNPEATYRYVWRDCFEHHQIVNRPDGVVRGVMIAGRFAWQDGAYVPAYGVSRFGSVLRHRDHQQDLPIPA
jgi:N-acyl-D-aspartate/D-glutamate deacylase